MVPPEPGRPAIPDADRAALLLDLDGTLIDFAATPDAVVVPDGLPGTLETLRRRTGDALAIVTGRTIPEIDRLLPDIPTAVAGEHGGAIRVAPDAEIDRPDLPPLPEAWIAAATALSQAHPGTSVERKARGLVLHYRQAPDAGAVLHDALADLLGGDPRVHLLASSMAWEVRPAGIDKGTAVRRLMQAPPFAGRLPIFIGDDVTDRDGIAAADALGGVGLLVPDVFGGPAEVRAWLGRLAEGGAWPGW